MKLTRGIIILGLYFAYLFVDGHQADNKIQEYSRQATLKADKNRDGKIDADEALAVYRGLGRTGEEILEYLDEDAEKRFLQMASPKTLAMLEDVERQWPRFNFFETPKERALNVMRSAAARRYADKNNDGKISFDEAADAFRTGFGEKSVGLRLFIFRDGGLCIYYHPSACSEGSELYRYVKGK